MTDADRYTSLTIRTASNTSPPSVVQTITIQQQRRSIPTYCLPAYASVRGLLALSHSTWILPITTLGGAAEARGGPAASSRQEGIRVFRPALVNYFCTWIQAESSRDTRLGDVEVAIGLAE